MAIKKLVNNKKQSKRWLSWLLVVVLYVGLIPMHELYTQASTGGEQTGETLPTGFTQVTPQSFGIDDFTENSGTEYQHNTLPISDADEVVLKANVSFGTGGMIQYFYNSYTGSGIRIRATENLYLCNYMSSTFADTGIYVGGRFENGEYIDGEKIFNSQSRHIEYEILASKISSSENFSTMNVSLAITTEFVDFDEGGTENDLKVGIWFNEKLYNETYFYMRNCLDTYTPSLKMTVKSMSSPEITTPDVPEPSEAMPEGFTQATPQLFGVDDYSGNQGTVYKNTMRPIVSADEVVFQTNISFGNGHTLHYFFNSYTQSGMKLRVNDNLYLCNYMTTSWDDSGIYVGGRFENNEYVEGERVFNDTTGRHTEYEILASKVSSVENFNTMNVSLAITTEYIDFDGGGTENDLKVGIWFNGKLYNETYLYMRNCAEGYIPYLQTDVNSLSSPEVDPPILPEITFDNSDKIQAGVYGYNAEKPKDLAVFDWIAGGFANRTFIGTLQFSDTACSYLNLGGKNSGWEGIQLVTLSDNKLYLQEATGAFSRIPIEGSWTGKDVKVKITFEVLSLDGGQEANDVRLWLYLNDELYKKQPIVEIMDYASELGNYIGIYCNKENATLEVVADAQGEPTNVLTVTELGLEPGEYVSAAGECYTADVGMDETSFVTQMRFEGLGATLYYGCDSMDREKAIKITSTEEGLLLTQTLGTRTVHLGEMDVTGTFDLEFFTEYVDSDGDGTEDDVRLIICVNEDIKTYYIKDAAGLMTATVRMLSDEDSSILIGEFAQSAPTEITHCVDTDVPYEAAKDTSATRFTVDGAKYEESAKLYTPGTYSVVEVKDSEIHMQDVTVYRTYDVDSDNGVDIIDLVKTLKLADEETRGQALATIDQAGQKAVGYEEATWTKDVADKTASGIRETIVTIAEVECSVYTQLEAEEADSYSFEFIGGTDVMPIGGFNGPVTLDTTLDYTMPTLISDQYFSLISESGVNLITHSNVFYDRAPSSVKEMLNLGAKYGVGITVADSRFEDVDITTEEARTYIADYKDYDAFCGVYAVDEPTSSAFYPLLPGGAVNNTRPISNYTSRIKALADLDVWSFGNLLGCGSRWRWFNYDSYVEEWLSSRDMKTLMWDYYVYDEGNDTEEYFHHLAYGRKKAAKYDIPFWGFVQAGSQWRTDGQAPQDSEGYYPNEGEFLWNVNTSLAYGAKGINYFPLIQPTYFAVAESTAYDFERNGMIGASGNLNRWYYYAQTANKQIAAVDEILMNSVSKGVIVTPEDKKEEHRFSNYLTQVPADANNTDVTDVTCLIEEDAWRELISITGDVLVGCFNYQGKSAFYVVNYDTEYAQNITLRFDNHYRFKAIQNAETSDYQANVLNLNMRAGEGVLVVME